jgi:hypothetical protein
LHEVGSLNINCIDDENGDETPPSICDQVEIGFEWKNSSISIGLTEGGNAVKRDGSNYSELTVTITNKTENKILLQSVNVVMELEAGNIIVIRIEEGNLTIGPGESGKQSWVFRISSNNEITGDYDVHIQLNGNNCVNPLTLKVVD